MGIKVIPTRYDFVCDSCDLTESKAVEAPPERWAKAKFLIYGTQAIRTEDILLCPRCNQDLMTTFNRKV